MDHVTRRTLLDACPRKVGLSKSNRQSGEDRFQPAAHGKEHIGLKPAEGESIKTEHQPEKEAGTRKRNAQTAKKLCVRRQAAAVATPAANRQRRDSGRNTGSKGSAAGEGDKEETR